MKYLKVITASTGLSGAGLIFDYLLGRDDFISPFKQYPDKDQQSEFRFITDSNYNNKNIITKYYYKI